MSQRPWAVVALVAVLAVRTDAADPAGALSDYAVLSWTETDGLPSSSIWALAQDADGYLWLGTNEGVIRFDGMRFVRWNALSPSPLPERRVMTLLSSSDGSLWVGFGGSGGVSRIRNMQVTHYDRRHGMAEDFIISLMEDRNHTIWAASPSGLYRLHDEQWERIGLEHGVPDGRVSSAHEDREGNLWIGTTAGIFRRSHGETTFRQVDVVDNIVNDFSEDPVGGIWITDPFVGFREVKHPARHDPTSGATRVNGTRLFHDKRGNLWLGTFGQGLWRVSHHGSSDAPAVLPITVSMGLAGNAVRSLLEDEQGNIWVGADGGLSRLSIASITAVRNMGTVRGVTVDGDGTVWAATANGLIRNPGASDQRTELPASNVSAVHADRRGTIWVATDQGVVRRRRTGFSRFPLPQPVRSERITAITTDSQGGVWLSDTGVGVFRLRHGQLTDITAKAQIGRRSAYGLYTDRQDRVWIAFSGGMLAVIDRHDRVQTYGPGAGGSLRTIYEGRGNTIWVGGDEGLSRLTNGRFVTAGRGNGLPGNAVTAVVEDPDGYLWAGVHAGIIRLSPSEFDALSDNPDYQIRYTLYDRSDGLAGLPLWLGSPTAFGRGDGRLWFVTGGGLAVVDSREVRGARHKPRARIENAVADESDVSILQGALLPPLTQRLQIEFAAPGYVSAAKVRFRYRLDGYDMDWVEAGSRRQALYTNLQPATYRFRVMANTTEGTWTEAGAAWDFSVAPTFYQTGWFYNACAVAVGLLLLGAWQLRLRRIRHQFALVLAERTRVGRELHDTLLQSLVGVALQIEALSERAGESPTALKEQLRSMRMQVEDYVREVRESIWELRSPRTEREDLVAALRRAGERAASVGQVRFEFTVAGTPRQCPPAMSEQLLRIAREAIQNSILHARATSIHLQLHYEASLVRLRVVDDGLGFDRMQCDAVDRHYGLRSMQERAELAGGNFSIISGPGMGTTIETVIPVSSGHHYVG